MVMPATSFRPPLARRCGEWVMTEPIDTPTADTEPSNTPTPQEVRPAAELLPELYTELRRLAAALTAQRGPGQTLQPTALVHEAYLRLVRDQDPGWQGRRPSSKRRHRRCARFSLIRHAAKPAASVAAAPGVSSCPKNWR